MSRSRAPAVVASILLHGGLFALALWQWPRQSLHLGSAVPVTIVASMEAQAPDLAPEPTPAVAPPAPEPEAAPPPPAAAAPPKPEPRPVGKQLAPKPTPAAQSRQVDTDFNAIGSLFGTGKAKAAAPRARPGPQMKPPTAPRRAPTAQEAANALAGMVGKVEQLWVLDCEAAGTREVVAPVRFTIASDGRVVQGPELINKSENTPLVARAAVAAVKKGAPYSLSDVPADYRNESIVLNFRAKDVCASR